MAEGGGQRRGGLAGLAALVGGFLSFRVVIALATSVSVTAAVAGPLALQALRMRDEPVEQAAAPPTPRPRPAAAVPATASPLVVTPAPEPPPPTAEPVVVQGRVTPARPTSATSTSTPATPASPINPTTTVAPTLTSGLAAGVAPSRSDAVALDGSRLAGRVFVFVTVDQVSAVRWWVDRPGRSGTPTRTSSAPPFDLGTPMFDAASLAAGRHRIDVELVTPTGVELRTASFDVVR